MGNLLRMSIATGSSHSRSCNTALKVDPVYPESIDVELVGIGPAARWCQLGGGQVEHGGVVDVIERHS